MASNSPSDERGDRIAPRREGRASLWRSWFGWLLPRHEPAAEESALSARVLRPTRSGKPPSALASAYARPSPPSEFPTRSETPAVPQWQVREPPESADAVPHQQCRLEQRNERWTLMGASLRGKLHAHQGLWRDDDFAWDWVGDWTCIAVADGAGSAPLARVGARLACQEGVRAIRAALADWQFRPREDTDPEPADLAHLRSLLADAARQAQTRIANEAETRQAALRDFHTTFLLLVHVPFGDDDLVAALQVGDGAVGLYTQDGACLVLGEADHGAYASETRFLTTPNISGELEQRVSFAVSNGLQALAGMTDGVADDFFPETQRLVQLFDGDPIADLKDSRGQGVRGVCLGPCGEPSAGAALADWLTYEKRGSSDDRTLVLFYRRREDSV